MAYLVSALATSACVAPAPGGLIRTSLRADGGQRPGSAPCWVGSSDCPGWSTDRYLIGVGAGERAGVGARLERATNRAYAALARQIKVGVKASLWIAAFESPQGTGEKVSEELRTTARILLEGAEIKGRWTGPSAVHVLVALDRRVFAERAAELGVRKAAAISQLIATADEAEAAGRRLEALRALSGARCMSMEAESRWEIARLVSPLTRIDPPAHSSGQLATRASQASSRVRVVPRIDLVGKAAADRPVVVEAVLRELTRLNITVSHGSAATPTDALTLYLQGTVSADPPREIAPSLYVARASASLKLMSQDGQILFGVIESDKGGGEQKMRAQVRALELLAPKVAASVVRSLGPALGMPSAGGGCPGSTTGPRP